MDLEFAIYIKAADTNMIIPLFDEFVFRNKNWHHINFI